MFETVPPEQYEFLPPSARKRIDELREHLSEPEVLRLDNGFRVQLASPRVVLTMDWRHAARSSNAQAWTYNSTLAVDGKSVPLVNDVGQLVALWNDPDLRDHPRSDLGRGEPKDAEIPVLGEAPDVVPAAIEAGYRRLCRGVAKHNGTVALGYLDGQWQVLATVPVPEVELFQVYLGLRLDDRGHVDQGNLTKILAVDGKDVTHLADEFDLAALGLDMPFGATMADPHAKPNHALRPARQNSVEVRRATVIRT